LRRINPNQHDAGAGELPAPASRFFARKYGTNRSIERLNKAAKSRFTIRRPAMGRMLKIKLAVIVLFMTFGVVTVWGTTWVDKEFDCPVCKNTALKTKYENKRLDKEKNEAGEANLSELVKEYIEKIQSPQKPRLMKDQ
jgi:hypothetical protein